MFDLNYSTITIFDIDALFALRIFLSFILSYFEPKLEFDNYTAILDSVKINHKI